MQAHELLGITLEQLRQGSIQLLEKMYQMKCAQVDREEKDKLALDTKKAELFKAFDELNSPEKRKDYLKKQDEKMARGVTNKDDKQFFVAGNNLAEIEKEYAQFVNENYKDHPNKPTFASKKQNYATFDEFKKSDYYKNLSEDDRKRYSETNFPKQTMTFQFANEKDALKFVKNLENKNLIPKGETEKVKQQLSEKKFLAQTKLADREEDTSKEKSADESRKPSRTPSPFNLKPKPKG